MKGREGKGGTPFSTDGFLWGVATAAYQVEGAVREDGRGPSIWDTFAHAPGKIANGENADRTCDQFHRWREDVALMKELGVGAYRFSLAWPRVMPDGKTLNPAGFDYYHRLIDALLESGIRPCPTLYHWDLPQALQDGGGWEARDTALRFGDYAAACYRALADRVSQWFTINEPQCVAYFGYETGDHAPGCRRPQDVFRVVHHLNLAHGLAVRALRAASADGRVGIALQQPLARAAGRGEDDLQPLEAKLDKQARIFLDPLYGRGYPDSLAARYPDRTIPVREGDLEVIASPCDFLGLNVYFRETVARDESGSDGFRTVQSDFPKTPVQWDIDPEAIEANARWVAEEYGSQSIYITENGCAGPDRPDADGRCRDTYRIAFLDQYWNSLRTAVDAGLPIHGYFLWSLIDNFEWNHGFGPRFGLVYCDFDTLERIPKDSFYHYQRHIAQSKGPG
ncbi:MAG: beta-glucosidase [Lentisphaerae bacterium]|nr:beta-glucosidase [Lentisphaerota bacterium]